MTGTGATAAVKALRGEEVLAWTQGHERCESGEGVGRRWLLRRGPTPGVPALLVCTCSRRGGALRVHLLAETGSSARTWALSDLRLVDGLGAAVRVAIEFALTFSGAPRPLYWKCDSPSQRARFLWSLLEACAARLPGRAPPSQRLSLLELQTFAKECALESSIPSPSPAPLPVARAPSPLRAERLSDSTAPPPSSRVQRTASEPQAGALHKLVAGTGGGATIDGEAVAAPQVDPNARDLTVYEHAFVLAARRIGARPPQFKRSRPAPPPLPGSPHAMPSLCDAIAREGGSATELLVKRCKAQEERRHYRLEGDDKLNLEHALQRYAEDVPGGALADLGIWLKKEMARAETANVTDTAAIELEDAYEAISSSSELLPNAVRDAQWMLPAQAALGPHSARFREGRARADMLARHIAHVGMLRNLIDQALVNSEGNFDMTEALRTQC